MALREVRGQEQAVTRLRKAVTEGRVAHTCLFYGPDGVGKELAAKNFAKALNCASPREADACDFCRECVQIEKHQHPDVHWLRPRGVSRVIPIEQVREFQRAISFKSFSARWKVGIFTEAHTMREDGANALLKTLEEPPAHTVIVLISSRREMLLPTIVSRCQIIRFDRMNDRALQALLQSDYAIEAGDARTVSILAEGRIGEAVRIIREERKDEPRKLAMFLSSYRKGYWELVPGILSMIEEGIKRVEEAIEWELGEKGIRQEAGGGEQSEELQEEIKAISAGEAGRRQEDFLRELLFFLRDVKVLKDTGDSALLLNSVWEREVVRMAEAMESREIDRAVESIDRARRLVRIHADFHAVMENLLVQLQAVRG